MSERLVAIDELTPKQIASICDHTFLNRPEAFREVAKEGESPVRLHQDAFFSFLRETVQSMRMPYAVCVRPENVVMTKKYLENYNKKIVVASVVGFPNGPAYSTYHKVAETELAIIGGAKEIDMVLNYEEFKDANLTLVEHDVREVVRTARAGGALVKLILETCELNPEQIARACRLADECSVDFVKTSTGFGAYGAREEDLRIMRKNFSKGVKISGEVNTGNFLDLLNAVSYKEDYVDLNPMKIRIGESSLLGNL